MCLFLKNIFQTKPYIAEEAIPIFKVLDSQMCSPYHKKQYELNTVIESELDSPELLKSCRNSLIYPIPSYINRGIHAFISKEYAFRLAKYDSLLVYKGVIPKGAKYYLGDIGDIVSNKIILHNSI